MNKRLEQEFNNFIDRLAIKESLAEGVHPSIFDLQRFSEHFYNLALEDVRNEVERRIAELQKWIDVQYGGDEEGRQSELIGLKDFIDNLTK